MDQLAEVAARYRLLIVEDAAQAHGAEYLSRRERGTRGGVWRRAGTFGRAAAFSFYPGKNLGACGEAGAVTTDEDEVARYIRTIRDHGQTTKYHHDIEGYNGRLDAIQAGFLRIKLRRLDDWNAQRRAAALRYNEWLRAVSSSLIAPFEPEWSRPVYHLYVLRTRERDGLARHLQANGIHTGLHYPIPVHAQQCYRTWNYSKGSLPVTEQVSAQVLSLPMFPGLTTEQQRRIVAAIDAFVTAGISL
jgi:dTDP-4-amino-4,6-dideoxygalactose transaminase